MEGRGRDEGVYYIICTIGGVEVEDGRIWAEPGKEKSPHVQLKLVTFTVHFEALLGFECSHFFHAWSDLSLEIVFILSSWVTPSEEQ